MRDRRSLIGVVDSGVNDVLLERVYKGRGFRLDADGDVYRSADFLDNLNHGTQTATAILNHLPQAKLCVAKVFSEGLASSSQQIAVALQWLIEQNVDLINMSLGLTVDREPIREACEEARARGIVLVASSPAHGQVVYPAAYNSVVSVTGDARCSESQCSYLNSSQAEFGASVRSRELSVGGASVAAAHFTGIIASTAAALNMNCEDALKHLRQSADIQGGDQTPWLGPNSAAVKHR